jgi:hypothetical protein
MTIGIEQFRDARELWLDRMLLQQFRDPAGPTCRQHCAIAKAFLDAETQWRKALASISVADIIKTATSESFDKQRRRTFRDCLTAREISGSTAASAHRLRYGGDRLTR